MKKILFILIILIGFNFNSNAIEQIITVTFKENTDKNSINSILLLTGTKVYKKESDRKYKLKIPYYYKIDDYAELFYYLPYVKDVEPLPKEKWEDKINSKVYDYKTTNKFQENEILVKFKDKVSKQEIDSLNSKYNIQILDTIPGINIHRLKLPDNLNVMQAIELYKNSQLVEYAEPNYKVSIPKPITSPPNNTIPQNSYHIVNEINIYSINEVFITFKPNTNQSIIELFNSIFQTKIIEKISKYHYKLRLPSNLSPQIATRIFKLCPYIINVEPTYGR